MRHMVMATLMCRGLNLSDCSQGLKNVTHSGGLSQSPASAQHSVSSLS